MRKAAAASLMLMLMAGAVLGTGLHGTAEVEASGHSATRSFASPTVAPESRVEVTIVAQDFGAFAQVAETLPDGFTYIGSSLPEPAVESAASTVTFTLLGVEEFTYTVEAPAAEAIYTFRGIVRDQAKDEETVGGDTELQVQVLPTPAPTGIPTPTPVPSETPEPPEPTPTAEPTRTPETTMTLAPTSTPDPTATPEPVATAEATTAPTPEPAASPTRIPTPSDGETPDEAGGLPTWPIPVLAGLVVIIWAFVLITFVRRRSQSRTDRETD